ncbi:transforming growth factor-beta-induced protein ig-h3-like [Penaeus chinensis]|uniref:transforming growth factor-beta-induced protein ig-h3-like n=1 Tax=Penaeus chinensis TaxID=139456 RepID=UPI001FB580C6|nr:transforming growth factor-beta-induced protein ig-h3-like [Penaeus chinensis]
MTSQKVRLTQPLQRMTSQQRPQTLQTSHTLQKTKLQERHLKGQQRSNLAEVLTARGFTQLVDLVVTAGLADTVSNGGPFTIFAPSNEAFEALDPQLVNSLLADTEMLKNVLLYHVVSGRVASSSLRDGMVVDSVQGGPLRINVRGNGVTVNDVAVTQADITARNGIVHVIDQVLMPPEDVGNLAEVLTSEGFSQLVDLVVTAGLADTVSNGGPFTIFAPTNEAFQALDPELVKSLLADPEKLKSVLLYHVVPGTVLSSALSDGLMAASVEGGDLRVNIKSNRVTVNDVAVTQADIPASNGVIHVIDQVLLPPGNDVGNLAEVLSGEGFSQLVDLVVTAGLAETVSTGGPFTIFAPTNEAFQALDPELVKSLLADPEKLKSVLLYHVVPGTVLSSALSDGLMVATAEGGDLRVNIKGNAVTVNDVDVTRADIQASNGVIHVVNQVLLPPEAEGNLAEVLTREGFSQLVDLVVTAGLADTVSDGGPFTIFAPTNEAFQALDADLVTSLVSDPERLKKVLLYHVVTGSVLSSDLSKNAMVPSVQGAPLKVSVEGTSNNLMVTVNGAPVTRADVPANNGVVHVIDQVLLPPEEMGNLAEVLSAQGFTQLVDLVVAAGLADTVSNGGPFTIFAPTNKAFQAVDKATLDNLLANTEMLKSVLLYHVVPSSVYSPQLGDDLMVNTVEGKPVRVNTAFSNGMGSITVNGVDVSRTDIIAKNGVIHVVDSVIMAPQGNVVEILAADPKFSTLVAAVKAAGLVDTLSSDGPFTVLAPTNDAFAKLPEGTLDHLLSDTASLKDILLRHVIPSSTLYSGALCWRTYTTANEEQVTTHRDAFHHIKLTSGDKRATVLTPDISATNGVIHAIDTVI